MSIALVWFRRDLRLADNPALHAAIESGARVIPVFIWSPDEESPWAPGAASRWWLHHSLIALSDDLRERDSRLIIRQGAGRNTLCWNSPPPPALEQFSGIDSTNPRSWRAIAKSKRTCAPKESAPQVSREMFYSNRARFSINPASPSASSPLSGNPASPRPRHRSLSPLRKKSPRHHIGHRRSRFPTSPWSPRSIGPPDSAKHGDPARPPRKRASRPSTAQSPITPSNAIAPITPARPASRRISTPAKSAPAPFGAQPNITNRFDDNSRGANSPIICCSTFPHTAAESRSAPNFSAPLALR